MAEDAHDRRLPVTVLTGFLGSGKTTRLNALLRSPHGRRLAVVMNEIGEVGIDGARVAGAEEFVELEGGCLCCVLNAELEATLRRLRARGGFDHLVVETTGIADPLPVAWTFERAGLRDGYRVDAIVCVVDALNVAGMRAQAAEVGLQIERADLVLLSKVDLVADGGAAAGALVRELNPAARQIVAPPGDTPWELILDRTGDVRPVRGASGHEHAHAWDLWRHRTTAVLSEARLERFLRALPPAVYRVKGLVRTDGDPAWVGVNAVAGRYEIEPCVPAAPPDASVLVCIGRGLDPQALTAAAAGLVVDASTAASGAR